MLNRWRLVRQRGAHALNCSLTECVGTEQRLFIEMSLMELGETECATILRALSADRGVRRNVLCEFRAHSSFPESEASVPNVRTTESAKKLMVRSTGDGGVSLCSAAFQESDCAVTDCVSHVKRVTLLPCYFVSMRLVSKK